MSPPSGSDPGGRDARSAARRERRARAEQRFQQLESARKERRAHARAAFQDAVRLPRVPSPRVLAAVGAAIVVLTVLLVWTGTRGGPEPLVARSCTTPALALSRAVTGDGRDVRWSATGPSAGAYTVVVDGRTIARPPLRDCTADGALPPLTAGAHRVQLQRDGRTVATVRLTG